MTNLGILYGTIPLVTLYKVDNIFMQQTANSLWLTLLPWWSQWRFNTCPYAPWDWYIYQLIHRKFKPNIVVNIPYFHGASGLVGSHGLDVSFVDILNLSILGRSMEVLTWLPQQSSDPPKKRDSVDSTFRRVLLDLKTTSYLRSQDS